MNWARDGTCKLRLGFSSRGIISGTASRLVVMTSGLVVLPRWSVGRARGAVVVDGLLEPLSTVGRMLNLSEILFSFKNCEISNS